MLTTTLLIVLLPVVTAPTISCYVSFVFRGVLGLYFLMPTSLRRLFPYSQNLSGSPCLILLNTEQFFFFSIFSLIRGLPNASKIDFNFSPFHMDLTRASLYDLKVPYPHSNSGKRTLAYSASKHFNDLNSDLREYFTASSPRTSKSLNSILSSIKCKLGNLFLSRLSSTEHLEDLLFLN